MEKLKNFKYYVLCFALLGGIIVGLSLVSSKNKSMIIPISSVEEDIVPVVITNEVLKRPYNKESVYILSNYYDYKGSVDKQLESIIFYNNTYMQNTGIIYASDEAFDVLAIADGKVTKISEGELTGKIIEITHENDVISVYKFLSDVKVNIDDLVKQGDIIGTSGISNITDSNKNQLYFELIVHGELMNGEACYDKSIEEL